MNSKILLLILAAVVAVGLLFYRFGTTGDLNVAPDAAREIDKAKQR